MAPEEARARFAAARVARLATADAAGVPHLVPVVFAVDGDLVYSAVDAKPKRTTALIGAIVLEELDFLVDAALGIIVHFD